MVRWFASLRQDGRWLLAGDPNGEAVLRELAIDSSSEVQGLAKFLLQRKHSPDDTGSPLLWMVRSATFDGR